MPGNNFPTLNLIQSEKCFSFSPVSEQAAFIGAAAQKTMLFELSASPKPGLVDRINSGAHQDMDYFTFIKSALALSVFFQDAYLTGTMFCGTVYQDLLNEVRRLGRQAEKKMFQATGGINTHKGQIFSLGVLSAAAGYWKMNQGDFLSPNLTENICYLVSLMCETIIEDDLESLVSLKENDRKLTYGERLYLEYGITGIRGEAKSGFCSVTGSVLPFFREKMNCDSSKINEHLVQALLQLMLIVDDSNVLGRGGKAALKWMRELAKEAIKAGGIYTLRGTELIYQMDRLFIEKNISPGGCADLLAVMYFLYYLEKNFGVADV